MADKADKSLDNLLSVFERVFSGETVYDEALMELGLHVAQVRKNYPNLFTILSGVGETVSDLPRVSQAKMRPALVAVEPDEIEEEIFGYTDWAKNTVHRSQVDDEFLLKWDVAGAPMFSSTQSLTLRSDQLGRRTRFTVTQTVSEDTFRVKIVAVLPLN